MHFSALLYHPPRQLCWCATRLSPIYPPQNASRKETTMPWTLRLLAHFAFLRPARATIPPVQEMYASYKHPPVCSSQASVLVETDTAYRIAHYPAVLALPPLPHGASPRKQRFPHDTRPFAPLWDPVETVALARARGLSSG